jgi:hypothetical protein
MVTYKLNPNQQAWVDELRSGKYAQCTGTLQSEDTEEVVGYCCLGVGCRVAEKHGNIEIIAGITRHGRPLTLNGGDLSHQPEAQDWLGLIGECGQLGTKIYVDRKIESAEDHVAYGGEDSISIDSLAGLNDEAGATFPEIADFIELHAEQLFKLDSLIQVEAPDESVRA